MGYICFCMTALMLIAGLFLKNPDAIAWGSFNTAVACGVLTWYAIKDKNGSSLFSRIILSYTVALSLYVSLIWFLWAFGIEVSIGAVMTGAIENAYPTIAATWVLCLMAYWGYKNEF